MAFSGVRSFWSSVTGSGGTRRIAVEAQGGYDFLPQDSVIISDRKRHANKLGEGSFAKVYRGEYNGKPCAVKVFKEDIVKKELSPDPGVTSEVQVLSKLQHTNIVQMYGMWLNPHKDRAAPSIVMELCDGSLYEFIRRYKGKIVPKIKKLAILQDIARGMVYLHGQNIVHGDLRSSNVLLCHSEDQTVAKIADFDMARFLDKDAQHHFTTTHTAEEYLPPEVFDHSEHKDLKKKWARLTPKVDVFCFGELVLEMGCGSYPMPTRKFRGQEMLTELQRRERHMLKLKQSDKESLGSIIQKCLADAPEGRPYFTEILLEVDGYLHMYRERPDLEKLQDKTAECEALRAEAVKWEGEAKSLSSVQDVLERELEKEKAEKQDLQSELREARDDLTEKVQLVATRDAELKVLNEKLVDCEKQMKDDQNAFKEGYRKLRDEKDKLSRDLVKVEQDKEDLKARKAAVEKDLVRARKMAKDLLDERVVVNAESEQQMENLNERLVEFKQQAVLSEERLKQVQGLEGEHLDLRIQLKTLTTTLEDFQKVLTDEQKSRKSLDASVKALTAEIDQLRTEIDQLRTELRERDNEVSSLTAANKHLQRKVDAADANRGEMKAEIDQLRTEMKERDNEVSSLTAANGVLQRKVDAADADITEMKRQLSEREDQRDSLQREKADLLHRNHQLAVEVQQQSDDKENVLKEKEEDLKQYNDVERKLHRLSGNHAKKMAESEKEIQRLKDQLEEARKKQLTVQAQEQEAPEEQHMDKEVTRLQEEISQLKEQLKALKEGKEQAKRQSEDLRLQNTELQNELAEMASKKDSLDAQLVTVNEEKRALLVAERKLTSEMEETQKELERMTVIAETSAEEKDKESQECQQLQERLKTLKEGKEQAKRQSEDLRLQNTELQRERENVRKQLLQAQDELAAQALASKASVHSVNEMKEKAARLQAELTESQRASETQRNELVATQEQRQLAEERDELVEKYQEADQLICRLKQEAEVASEDLQNIKEKNAELREQLLVEVKNQHELEARAKEKLIAASNQMLKLEEEAEETRRQLHEAEAEITQVRTELKERDNEVCSLTAANEDLQRKVDVADADITEMKSEETVIPPKGSDVGATDEWQSKVGELEDKVKDLERKVANLFMDNVALKTKLEASWEVERQQYEEIACLKEQLVQDLKAQDTATQEQSLSRTRESELEEEIKVLEETRSDLEAEVEKLEKQMKQLETLPSDVEQLTKAEIDLLRIELKAATTHLQRKADAADVHSGEMKEKTVRLQGELAEKQRASEADRNELVAAKVQRLLAEKERDEQAEKCLLACQQRETVRNEAEEKEKQLKTLKEERSTLHHKVSDLETDNASLQEKLSDIEKDKDKLQASRQHAERLEAEREEYQRKFADSNEWIMHHHCTQDKEGSPKHLLEKTEFHTMMELFKVYYEKASKRSEQTAEENQRLLASNYELKEKVQELAQASHVLQEKLSEKQKLLEEQQRETAVLREELSTLQEIEVVPSLASDIIEQTDDEVLLQRLCYMATGIKQLLITPDGGTFILGNGDASLKFPPGAVQKDIHIRYAIILYGPFVLPAGYKPGSVIVYLNMDGATLVKPIQLLLSHWCIRKETDDEETMMFVRAPHSLESGKKEYAFEEVEEEADFNTHFSMGVLTIQKPHCLYCVEVKHAKNARYCAMTFSRYVPSEDILLFRIQLMCDSLDWIKELAESLAQRGWKKSASSDIVPRFGFTAVCIAASTTVSQGPGWSAMIEGTHEVKEADFLMPKGKSKYAMKQEVCSGRYPPCICYKVVHSVPEERRMTPAILKVDLVGADVHLTFSCTFKAAEIPASPVSPVSISSATSVHLNLPHTGQRTSSAESSAPSPVSPGPIPSAETPPSSPQAKISKPADVVEALKHDLDAQWRQFGTYLRVEPVLMDSIVANNSKVEDCMLQLVEKWLGHENGTDDRPRTWETVVQAVKNTGKGHLAEELAEKHGVQLSRQ